MTDQRRTTAEIVAWFNARYGITDFDAWVRTAQPGARIVYGRGVSTGDCPAGVATRMFLLAQHELVLLVQKRVLRDDAEGNARYPMDYLAIRAQRPLPASFPQLLTLERPSVDRARVVSPRTGPTMAPATRDGFVSNGGRSW